MSGIAALWRRDGHELDPSRIQDITRRLAHRGPDGEFIHLAGNMGIGLQLFRTTAASLQEKGLATTQEGDLVAACDIRLDNRAELLRELDIDPSSGGRLSDPDMVLAAYRKWGTRTSRHLLGDFSFVVWDAREGRMYCARDHFGIKQLYFIITTEWVAVANDIAALVGLLPARCLHLGAAIHYLTWDNWQSHSTLFDGVRRLLPAHDLVVHRGDYAVEPYWRLSCAGTADISLPEAADHIRTLLTTAVSDRVTFARTPPGSFLSGGLDSSSISLIARDELRRRGVESPMNTFSAIYGDSGSEHRSREAILALGGFAPNRVASATAAEPLSNLDLLAPEDAEPHWSRNSQFAFALRQSAATLGVQIMLDGEGGDDVIGYGLGHLEDLARHLSLVQLVRASRAVGRHGSFSGGFAAWQFGVKPLTPMPVRLLRARLRRLEGSWLVPEGYLDRAALRHLRGITQETREFSCDDPERRNQVRDLERPLNHLINGYIDRLSGILGLESRYPFLDVRLVEFCLSLPGEYKLHDGWQRYPLRAAMSGVLPEAVRWRTDKGSAGQEFVDGMVAQSGDLLGLGRPLEEGPTALLRPGTVGRLHGELTTRAGSGAAFLLWRVLVLGRWIGVNGVGSVG